ncbi:RICIN domain-containing protein [Streptomyces klenkii]|uniref:RICIN domain-containing protein n=1 Tax=Streptomyces klenkii TaxID=1420899 RepID=UPI0034425FA4
MKKQLIGKLAAVALVAPALALASTGQAFADGTVTWKNKGTNKCLSHISGVAIPGDCGSGYTSWYEKKQSDGTFVLKTSYQGDCLQHYKGNLRTVACDGSNYQKWYETKFSNGWRLTNKATGGTLGTNSSNGLYAGIDAGGKLQRWG